MKKTAARVRILTGKFYEELIKKKSVLLFSFLLIFNSVFFAQEIIENPKKPLNKNAGRIVRLKEIMRIRDDGVEVIFRAPYGLQIGHNGSIYFYDN